MIYCEKKKTLRCSVPGNTWRRLHLTHTEPNRRLWGLGNFFVHVKPDIVSHPISVGRLGWVPNILGTCRVGFIIFQWPLFVFGLSCVSVRGHRRDWEKQNTETCPVPRNSCPQQHTLYCTTEEGLIVIQMPAQPTFAGAKQFLALCALRSNFPQ